MNTTFCTDTLEAALSTYGRPEIFNTDQGAQFTSDGLTDRLKAAGVAISMDGKGRRMNNVFVERLWHSVKYEEAYLKAYEMVTETRDGIGRYLDFYNTERRHLKCWNELRRKRIILYISVQLIVGVLSAGRTCFREFACARSQTDQTYLALFRNGN